MSNLSFGPPLRLTENADIQFVCRKGKKLSSPFMAVFYCSTQKPQPRLCVSVSKKQIPKAYLRHRIKRIFRESFRLKQHDLPAYDIVVVAYKTLRPLDRKALREKMDEQWQKLLASHKRSS